MGSWWIVTTVLEARLGLGEGTELTVEGKATVVLSNLTCLSFTMKLLIKAKCLQMETVRRGAEGTARLGGWVAAGAQ